MEAEYAWEELYMAASLETDDRQLPMRIEEARRALDARIPELTRADAQERMAIGHALHSLRILWIERCPSDHSRKGS